MNDISRDDGRTVGLIRATGVGIGAIVGGGVLILAGAAFQATGPSVLVAFALNGVISLLTALSVAEMSTAFPESGGAYIFAKKVLSVRAAFGVGWVLWFAYIVAAVLYALGFAEFGVALLGDLCEVLGFTPPAWFGARRTIIVVALAASGGYALSLSALQASLLAASRVAFTMARDRTLPRVIAEEHPTRRTPVMAVYTTFVALVAILPEVAAR